MLNQKPILLTATEVRNLLNISRARVYNLITENILAGVRVGSTWRIRTSSVEAYLGREIDVTELS